MPKNRISIYELLLTEGATVVNKDVHTPKQTGLADKNMRNLHVMKAQVPRLWQGAVGLETLLLVPHQRGHPVPLRLPAPAAPDPARRPALQPADTRGPPP